jgi:hypothetical protein
MESEGGRFPLGNYYTLRLLADVEDANVAVTKQEGLAETMQVENNATSSHKSRSPE